MICRLCSLSSFLVSQFLGKQEEGAKQLIMLYTLSKMHPPAKSVDFWPRRVLLKVLFDGGVQCKLGEFHFIF